MEYASAWAVVALSAWGALKILMMPCEERFGRVPDKGKRQRRQRVERRPHG